MTSPTDLRDDPRYLLGEISAKVDLVLAQQAAQRLSDERRFTKIEASLDEQAGQIAALKRDRSWVLGGAAAISTAVGGAATWLGLIR